MHKRKRYVLPGIVIFAITAVLAVIYITMPRGKPVILPDKEMLYSAVKDGDIICRLGDRLWSRYFKDMSVKDKRYSHLGIIRINNGQITVIHSEGDTGHGRDYVNEVSLEDFIKIARAIGVYRIKDMDGALISNAAIKYLGVPFDWDFDLSDESKIYCTELLYIILKRLKPELELPTAYLKQLGKDIIPLESISASEHFTEIFYTHRQ